MDRIIKVLGFAALMLFFASLSTAQDDSLVRAYVGRNGTGYLKPLADALGANLNSGIFNSAKIPSKGFYFRVEARFMSVIYGEGDREFLAVTPDGFQPQQEVMAPTIVGDRYAIPVSGDGGTTVYFPGGFDVESLNFATPQLRVGSFHGTEALLRFLIVEVGDLGLNDLSLWGLGIRHSLSQYFDHPPLDVSVSALYQRFSMRLDQIGRQDVDTKAWSVGLQASRSYGGVEPYLGFSMDNYTMDLDIYEIVGLDLSKPIDYQFGPENDFRLTLGLSLTRSWASVHGEFSLAGQKSYSIGLAVGK